MENRRRKGRRRRDENRTLEVRSSIEMSNLRFLKIHEILLVFVVYFEIWPFPFEGPAQTKLSEKQCQKTLKKHTFSSDKPSTNHSKIEIEKGINKSSKKEHEMEPQVINKSIKINKNA